MKGLRKKVIYGPVNDVRHPPSQKVTTNGVGDVSTTTFWRKKMLLIFHKKKTFCFV